MAGETSGLTLLVKPRSPRSGAPQARALRAASALGPWPARCTRRIHPAA